MNTISNLPAPIPLGPTINFSNNFLGNNSTPEHCSRSQARLAVPYCTVLIVQYSATTAADVTAAMFKFKCDVCGREFDKQSDLKIHKSRWCNGPGTGNDRSRRDQRADKIIKAVKLDKLVAAQECIKLNGESIANVARTKYL